jgi:hypothetical protein
MSSGGETFEARRTRSHSPEAPEACAGALENSAHAIVDLDDISSLWFPNKRGRSLLFTDFLISEPSFCCIKATGKLICHRADPRSFDGGHSVAGLRASKRRRVDTEASNCNLEALYDRRFEPRELLNSTATLLCVSMSVHFPYSVREGDLNHLIAVVLTRDNEHSTSWTAWVIESNRIKTPAELLGLEHLVRKRLRDVLPSTHVLQSVVLTEVLPDQETILRRLGCVRDKLVPNDGGVCYIYVCAGFYLVLRLVSERSGGRIDGKQRPQSGQQLMQSIFLGQDSIHATPPTIKTQFPSFSKLSPVDEGTLARWIFGSGSCRGLKRRAQVVRSASTGLDRERLEDSAVHPLISAIRRAEQEMPLYRCSMLSTVGEALPFLKKDGNWLRLASGDVKNDFRAVLAAVTQVGSALQFASPDRRNDETLVLRAIEKDSSALAFASPELLNHPSFMKGRLERNGLSLKYASPELRDDRQTVLAAVRQNGLALEFASEKLRAHPVVVRAALGAGGGGNEKVLDFVKEGAYENLEVLHLAVKLRGSLLEYGSREARDDYFVVLDAVKQDGMALKYASPRLRSNIDVVRAASGQNSRALRLVQDRAAILAALAENGSSLRQVRRVLWDVEIVRTAVAQNLNSLALARSFCDNEPTLMRQVLEELSVRPQRLSEIEEKETTLWLLDHLYVEYAACDMAHVHAKLQSDPDVVLAVRRCRQRLRLLQKQAIPLPSSRRDSR